MLAVKLNINFDMILDLHKQGYLTVKARNEIIKAEYLQLPPEKKEIEKREMLAKRWCLSESSIRDIIYTK